MSNQWIEIQNRVDAAREWGTSSEAQPITQITKGMLEKGCYSKLLLKSQVIWDVETIHDAVNDACIILGLDEEEFAASYHDLGCEIDLRLV